MDTLDLLYDHYKESVSQMKSIQQERDHFFIVLCILLTVLFVLGADPSGSASVIQQIVEAQWGVTATISFDALQSFVWILLLYYTIRYVQRNTASERITQYIHSLEDQISSVGDFRFDREGKNYLSEYPIVQDIIYWVYTVAFPLLYLFLIIYKLVGEFAISTSAINVLIAVLNLIVIFAYLCFLHKHKIFKIIGIFKKHT